MQAKLSRSGATPAAAAEATAEAAAAAAAHVSLVNALRCQLSLNKHSNAPANGRHTWLHFQQKSTPTPDTLTHTHVFTVALTFTSIFTSSLPSTRNVNSVDSTHLSELRSSRRAPHPNPSSNPQSQFQFQLPPSRSPTPFPLPLLAALSGPQIFTPC